MVIVSLYIGSKVMSDGGLFIVWDTVRSSDFIRVRFYSECNCRFPEHGSCYGNVAVSDRGLICPSVSGFGAYVEEDLNKKGKVRIT